MTASIFIKFSLDKLKCYLWWPLKKKKKLLVVLRGPVGFRTRLFNLELTNIIS